MTETSKKPESDDFVTKCERHAARIELEYAVMRSEPSPEEQELIDLLRDARNQYARMESSILWARAQRDTAEERLSASPSCRDGAET